MYYIFVLFKIKAQFEASDRTLGHKSMLNASTFGCIFIHTLFSKSAIKSWNSFIVWANNFVIFHDSRALIKNITLLYCNFSLSNISNHEKIKTMPNLWCLLFRKWLRYTSLSSYSYSSLALSLFVMTHRCIYSKIILVDQWCWMGVDFVYTFFQPSKDSLYWIFIHHFWVCNFSRTEIF